MLVEIPDPEVILGGVVAFLIGIFGLFLYYKLKPYVNLKPKNADPAYLERLEYYERQLIDMKIRLDALDMADLSSNSQSNENELKKIIQKLAKDTPEKEPEIEIEVPQPQKQEIMPSSGPADITDHVLRLITDKSMTSRDIQITIGRSREHTSRLMKKLYDDGLVERHTNSKPYTYSISNKGREKLLLTSIYWGGIMTEVSVIFILCFVSSLPAFSCKNKSKYKSI